MFFLELDYKLFHLINSLAGKYKFLDLFFIFCAVYLIWIMVCLAFVWWLELHKTRPSRKWPFFGKRKWLEFGSICFSIAGAVIANQAVSLLHFRSRPFVLFKIVNLVSEPFSSKSFPSDHTAIAFAIAGAIFFHNKKFGKILFFLAFLVGISRIYTGVHYPLDILCGAVIGIFVAFVVDKIAKKIG